MKKIMFNSIVNKLEKISELVPEQRFGQILYNYLTSAFCANDTFYASDKAILDILDDNLEKLEEQTAVRQVLTIDEKIKELRAEKQRIIAEKWTSAEKEQYKKFFTKI